MKIEIDGWITTTAAILAAAKVATEIGLSIEQRIHERRTGSDPPPEQPQGEDPPAQ